MRDFFTQIPSGFSVVAAALLLSSCGGDDSSPPPSSGPNPSPAPAPAPTPTPAPPSTAAPNLTQAKLLSDDELRTAAISPAPVFNQTFANWADANHQPIRSVTYDGDFSDLRFLDGLIGSRSVVQLGESSHGTREFNQVKTRLIKYLHQEKDFSVVAFESGFFDANHVDRNRASLTADQEMRFIFSVWHTNEVLELFRYAQSTQNSSRPLRFVGFDTQNSSAYYERIFPYISAIPASSGLSPSLNAAVRQNLTDYLDTQRRYSNGSCFSRQSSACTTIVNQGVAIRSRLDQNLADLDAASQSDEAIRTVYISVFAAANQISNLEASYLNGDTGDARDLGMARIFELVQSDLIPGQKVVIWAHNRHVAHMESPTTPINAFRNYPVFPMGYHLHRSQPNDLYTIGLYMLRGQTGDNSGNPVEVLAPKPNSLEAIAYAVRKAALFINSSDEQARTAGNAFLFERIEAHNWGGTFGSYSMIPSDQFDGILFIDTSTLPAYR